MVKNLAKLSLLSLMLNGKVFSHIKKAALHEIRVGQLFLFYRGFRICFIGVFAAETRASREKEALWKAPS